MTSDRDQRGANVGSPRNSSPLRERDLHTKMLAEHVESISKLTKRVIRDVIEVGRRLTECKALLDHGDWLPWLHREFRWSERSARNFMMAYEYARTTAANVADFGIDVSSLYLLAMPSTPEVARAEVLRRIEDGHTPPHAEVKAIIGEAKNDNAAARRTTRRMSVHQLIQATSGGFATLPAVVRAKILEGGPERVELGMNDAAKRQGLKLPYRSLDEALSSLEAAASSSTGKILAAIPVEHLALVAARVERSKNFLIKLDAKLQQNIRAQNIRTLEPKVLAKRLSEARKSCVKKIGHANPAQILEAMWTQLTDVEIEYLRTGALGKSIKTVIEDFMIASLSRKG